MESPSESAQVVWHAEQVGWLRLQRAPESRNVFDIARYPGAICAWSLCQQGSQSNEIFLESNESSSIGAVIARLQDLIVTSGHTSMLRVLHDPIRHSEHSDALASFGIQYAFRTTLMLRDILSMPMPSVDQRIVAAETRREYDAAISVMQEVFGGTRELTEFFNPFASAQLFVALTERGVAVSASAIWPCEKVAGLHNVATLPLFRNRGHAHAVVIEALGFARSSGFQYAGLRARAALVCCYECVGLEIAGYLDHYRYGLVVHEE